MSHQTLKEKDLENRDKQLLEWLKRDGLASLLDGLSTVCGMSKRWKKGQQICDEATRKAEDQGLYL